MHPQARHTEAPERARILRYAANGVVATAVHFAVLTFNLQLLEMRSAGLANMLAATAGILVSFLGNRYFVFDSRTESILIQAGRFGVLYASIAILHGAVLYGWTDLMQLDYRIGFVIAVAIQVALGYYGNKSFVYRR